MASYSNLRNMYHSGTANIGDKVSVEYLTYKSPLAQRYSYAVEGMSYNFSEYKKFQTWRKLWLYLAKAQKVSSSQPPVVLVLVYTGIQEKHGFSHQVDLIAITVIRC